MVQGSWFEMVKITKSSVFSPSSEMANPTTEPRAKGVSIRTMVNPIFLLLFEDPDPKVRDQNFFTLVLMITRWNFFS